MKDLILALQIFAKYTQDKYPTNCDHDVLMVMVDPDVVSDEDKIALNDLGFNPSRDGNFQSFRFGSC